MRWVIALFSLTVLATTVAGIGLAVSNGRIVHRAPAMRTIHYDNLDVSAQRRRTPVEANRPLQR
jgi:hypothetical protein